MKIQNPKSKYYQTNPKSQIQKAVWLVLDFEFWICFACLPVRQEFCSI